MSYHFVPDRQTALEQSAKDKAEVQRRYPAAVKVIRVTGGWAAFDYWTDYETWRKQK